jgi:hypothetical protein
VLDNDELLPALLAVAAVCVGVLAYVASALITLTERRSVYTSIAVAVAMSLGYVALVVVVRSVIARHW